ncbi:hypothetical protein Tco_1336043 [Tanacetum coccineum]
MTESPLVDSNFAVPVFSPGDDPIAYLNKAMAFLGSPQPIINLALPRIQETKPLFKMVGSQCNKYRGDKVKVILVLGIRVMLLVLGEIMQADSQGLLHATTIQTGDLDTYDSDCDDLSSAQAVLMANISNYGSDIISEVPHSETYLNDMENQSVHAMQDFEQIIVVDFSDIKIHSDSNIFMYSQYLEETQQANIQDTHLQAQQDSMILSVIEQMSKQMINHVDNWEKDNKETSDESITVGA